MGIMATCANPFAQVLVGRHRRNILFLVALITQFRLRGFLQFDVGTRMRVMAKETGPYGHRTVYHRRLGRGGHKISVTAKAKFRERPLKLYTAPPLVFGMTLIAFCDGKVFGDSHFQLSGRAWFAAVALASRLVILVG